MKLKRMWVNQPSTLQPWHKYHGQNVLAPREPATALVTVYFTSGSVIAMDINTIALSEGWK